MANLAKRRKKRKLGTPNSISGVTLLYGRCARIRGELERAAEKAYRAAHGITSGRLEEDKMIAALVNVPTIFAIREQESHGWYKRPTWAAMRYGAK